MALDRKTTPLGKIHCLWRLASVKAVIVYATAVVIAGAWSNHADATPIVDGSELVGATNVSINDSFFDVTFVEGNCFNLFNQCNEASDFDFQTVADALAAAEALLDQVFIDGPLGNFDSDPELTFSCVNAIACTAVIPFNSEGFSTFDHAVAVNHASPPIVSSFVDFTNAPFSNFRAVSSTAFGGGEVNHVFAQFTETQGPFSVPEPAMLALFGFGLGGLALARRRRK